MFLRGIKSAGIWRVASRRGPVTELSEISPFGIPSFETFLVDPSTPSLSGHAHPSSLLGGLETHLHAG